MAADATETPVIDAATVVIVRSDDDGDGVEVLMLHKNAGHAFGGMWVFPGGRVDPDDGSDGDGDLERARHAAVREAEEEAGLVVAPEDLVAFAHWLPPPEAPRRFATWFFVAEASDVRDVVVDGSEIADHAWVVPAEALERQGRGEIELAPPTWITLHWLASFTEPAEVMAAARAGDPVHYATHIAGLDGALVALWDGDAGYEAHDPAAAGPRHRLVMSDGAPWTYERT
jgi:8-oxo-dGTP pyrophosphatase MutT (NUDIX family)